MQLVKMLVPAALLALGGCTVLATAGGQPGSISGSAAGLFGIPAATVFAQISAEITQIEMLKAQLDGTTMPVLPAPTSPINVPIIPSGSPTGTIAPGPVVMTPAGSFPSSPVVTPP